MLDFWLPWYFLAGCTNGVLPCRMYESLKQMDERAVACWISCAARHLTEDHFGIYRGGGMAAVRCRCRLHVLQKRNVRPLLKANVRLLMLHARVALSSSSCVHNCWYAEGDLLR